MKQPSYSIVALSTVLALLCSCASIPTSMSNSVPSYEYEVVDEDAGCYRITRAPSSENHAVREALTTGYECFASTYITTVTVAMVATAVVLWPLSGGGSLMSP